MPAPTEDTNLADLERQRRELEDNVRKLQQSLYHWRLWEAEYDGLKEELASLREDATRDELLDKGREFGGSVVTEDEVRDLLGLKKQSQKQSSASVPSASRSRDQVVQLIARRIDYVRQNVATMEKRLQAAEDRLNELLGVTAERPRDVAAAASKGGGGDDDGGAYPVTEIVEELDEEGNVIKGTTTKPGEQAPELLEVLKKAGVMQISDRITEKAKAVEQKHKQGQEKQQEKEGSKPAAAEKEVNGAAHPTAAAKPEKAEDVRPVTDVDESPEDAKLRREMLQYGLNEVGAIVAELELDENASEFSITDEEYDSYEDVDPDDESESEDEYGRTTRRVLTDEIHQQMRELERKLNARGMLNIGRDTTSLPEEVRRELEEPRVDRVEKSEASQEAEKAEKAEKAPETKPKKKVAFAPELDIAPDPEPPAAEKKTRPRKPETPAVSDTIVERTEAVKEEKRAEERKPPKKVSRFKSARAAGTPTAETITTTPAPTASTTKPPTVRSSVGQPDPSSLPLFPAKPKEPKPFSQPIAADIIENDTLSSSSRSRSRPSEPRPPEGKILADNLVEREVSEGSAAPPDPDELDEELHRKEIATEFHRMRNWMIHRSGGYLNDDERETVPLDEDEDEDQTADGQPKRRVSRFKAARMR
ncbi:Prefoldin subunit-domain-containing protein [Thermoascus aurantiacus ATCC 26904]